MLVMLVVILLMFLLAPLVETIIPAVQADCLMKRIPRLYSAETVHHTAFDAVVVHRVLQTETRVHERSAQRMRSLPNQRRRTLAGAWLY